MPETADRQPIEDTGSLSDHEAAFHGRRTLERQAAPAAAAVVEEAPAVETPPPATDADKAQADEALAESVDPARRFQPPAKRAQKDKARPEDVPRIRELTGKLKDLARERDEWKAKVEAAQRPVVPSPTPAVVSPPTLTAVPEKFTFATFDQWLTQNPNGTYEDWTDAKLEARDTWREQRQAVQRAEQERQHHVTAAQQAEQARFAAQIESYQGRLQTYLTQHPDRVQTFQGLEQANYPAALVTALMRADNGPELVYTLRTRPDLMAEAYLITDGKPASDQYVAFATQWLQTRVSAGSTAATTPRMPKQPPKPPTAVRTGPMQTGTEPPGDGASLAEHEAFYTQKRRR